MAKSKIISITGVTSNEAKQQFENLKKMVLPEMLLDRLNSDTLKQDNKLKTALESFFSGIELLNLLGNRVKKLKVNKELFPDNEQSMLKEVDNELKIMAKTLTASYTSKEKQFSDALTSALLIGYHTGAHDMRVNLEKHAERGFQKGVLDTQAGGIKTAAKTDSLKSLILEMANYLDSVGDYGKLSKKILAQAIHPVIYDFYIKNKELECFHIFKRCEDTEAYIKNHLHKPKLISEKGKAYPIKLSQLLKKKYNTAEIRNKLK